MNFFLPPLWEVRSVVGGVSFTPWEWGNGFAIVVNGFEIFRHQGSWAMIGAFAFVILGGIASLVRSRKATFLASLFAGLAAWLAWEQVANAAKIAAANTAPGVLEISIGSAKSWILIPLAVAVFVCGYAAIGADQKVMFGPKARDED